MKITKRQLRRIIKEEKAKLAEYGDYPRTGDRVPAGMGDPSKALSIIHDGIDKLIYAIGNENAYLELAGIIEEWEN
jgi:hypothetical protein